MYDFFSQFWDETVDIATLIIALVGSLGAIGFFRKEQITRGEKYTLELERDDLRQKWAGLDVRLDHIDPERFIDTAQDLYDAGKYAELEKRATDFANRQTEAFGKAAEYLAEQNIIDSDTHPQAAEDALRFARIGRAAFPDSKRLAELEDLAARRKDGIDKGEPIEALNMDGMSGVDLNRLSIALQEDGKYILAEIAARRSVPLARLQSGKTSANYAVALAWHAVCLQDLKAYAEAETLYHQALEIDRATIGEGHPEYARHLHNLAGVVQAQGRHSEAETLYLQALEIDRATIGEGHPDYARHLNGLAGVVEDQRRFAEAETLFRQALKIAGATIGEKHPHYANGLNDLAGVVKAQERTEEAETLYRQALEIDRATIGEGHPHYATHLVNLGDLLAGQGKYEDARAMFTQAIAIREATLPADHPDLAKARALLAKLPPE